MNTIARMLFATILLMSCMDAALAVGGGYGERVHLTSVEIAQLPKFCWAQLEVPGAVGPEYQMQNCGVGMNHYCGGLVSLLRAKNPVYRAQRVTLLDGAYTDILYTEKWMKAEPAPNCSIRAHVQSTKAEVETLMKIYGVKRGGAK
jgi:hypothetical protein